jgi:hypothetical protein
MSRIPASVLIVSLAFAVSGFTTNSAHALLFNWSFTSSADFDDPGGIVSGTIDGLVEGSNDGSGLTIEVVSTPTGELLGGGWIFDSVSGKGDAFTVTGGQVAFASVLYTRGGTDSLFFGSDPQGPGQTFFPQLTGNLTNDPDWGDFNGSSVFSPVSDQSPPIGIAEPATLALYGIGLLGLGYIRRGRVS